MKKKDFSEFTSPEIEGIAGRAGLEAREKVLNAGREVTGGDLKGNITIEKMP